jgi:hypothetical protein
MSEMAKRDSVQNLTDGWDETAAEAESRVIRGSLLKFSEGRWSIGKENEAVKERRQLFAVATAAAWVRWQAGKPVEYRLRETGVPMPVREELGDCDRTSWENGPDGQPRDPWQSTRFVQLIDPLTAESFTFATSSGGGLDCVINLADQIMRMRGKHPKTVPLVELGSAPMPTKYGRKTKPVLRVVDWRNTVVSAVIEQPDHQLLPPVNDMDDDIPF